MFILLITLQKYTQSIRMNAIKVENLLKIAFHFHFRRFTSTIENKMQITEGCQYELSSVFWTIQKWGFYQRTYVENLKYRPGSPPACFHILLFNYDLRFDFDPVFLGVDVDGAFLLGFHLAFLVHGSDFLLAADPGDLTRRR